MLGDNNEIKKVVPTPIAVHRRYEIDFKADEGNERFEAFCYFKRPEAEYYPTEELYQKSLKIFKENEQLFEQSKEAGLYTKEKNFGFKFERSLKFKTKKGVTIESVQGHLLNIFFWKDFIESKKTAKKKFTVVMYNFESDEYYLISFSFNSASKYTRKFLDKLLCLRERHLKHEIRISFKQSYIKKHYAKVPEVHVLDPNAQFGSEMIHFKFEKTKKTPKKNGGLRLDPDPQGNKQWNEAYLEAIQSIFDGDGWGQMLKFYKKRLKQWREHVMHPYNEKFWGDQGFDVDYRIKSKEIEYNKGGVHKTFTTDEEIFYVIPPGYNFPEDSENQEGNDDVADNRDDNLPF